MEDRQITIKTIGTIEISVAIMIGKLLYKTLRPWLKEQASKSDTPLDDWVIVFLDTVLGENGAIKANEIKEGDKLWKLNLRKGLLKLRGKSTT